MDAAAFGPPHCTGRLSCTRRESPPFEQDGGPSEPGNTSAILGATRKAETRISGQGTARTSRHASASCKRTAEDQNSDAWSRAATVWTASYCLAGD